MKLKTVILLVLVGFYSQSYAQLVVIGKNHTNSNQLPLDQSAQTSLSKGKPSNKGMQKTCNEISKIANKAITARFNGERVNTIQGEVNEMYDKSSSPVKNDRTFNFMAHKVILSAYSETHLPPASDRKAQAAFKNKFSQDQKTMCIEYMTKTAL